ncbi:hypothetical protein MTO96_005135 [Rhipicephalus appendiculatus]
MAVPVGSAPADHASPACVSAVHTSVVPASPVLPAAAPAPAVLPPTVDAMREIRTVLRPPEEHPPTVPAVSPESVPVLRAAKVLPPVASAPTVLVPVLCTISVSGAPSHSPSEPHHYRLVPTPTVPKVHWKKKFMGRFSGSTGLLWAATVQTPFVEMAPIQASAPYTQT